MFKNQLQELAQRSSFNLPSYSCVREGPDHAPKFKATVVFNGESFESPGFFNTLRLAENAAAEVALNTLSKKGPTQSLASRILDETGVCKNLLQETAQRAGIQLPTYSVEHSGPGHIPVFVCTVHLAGMRFVGESAKTKKQAEKNAATAAWTSLKQFVNQASTSSQSAADSHTNEEQTQLAIIRMLMNAAQNSSSSGPKVQGPPPLSRPVPSSRIRITPFAEQPGEERVPLLSSSQTSVDTQTNIKTDQEQELGINYVSGETKTPTASSRLLPDETGTVAQQRLACIQTVAHGTSPHVTYFPINPVHSDAPNWAHSGTSTYIITNSGDASSSEPFIPFVPPGYTVIWTGENHQYINASPTFKPAASLAPRVQVRQAIPVCSAPPPSSESKNHSTETTEAALLQGLGDLKL